MHLDAFIAQRDPLVMLPVMFPAPDAGDFLPGFARQSAAVIHRVCKHTISEHLRQSSQPTR